MLDWPGLCRQTNSSSSNCFLAPNGNFPELSNLIQGGPKVVSVAKFPGNSSTGSYLTPIIVKSWLRLYQMKHFQEISKWGGVNTQCIR